jgi:predicted helicase
VVASRKFKGWATRPDPSITKWNIFHYVYAVLHHPDYRQRYAANLRRELPRIPFVGGSATLNACHSEPAKAGEESAVPGGNAAGKQQIPPSGRNDNAKTNPVPPFSGDTREADIFRAYVQAGQHLAEIHVHYEQQPEYPLTKVEKSGEKLDYRVTKMKLSKDKTPVIYNQFLTLSGIPPETYEYRLGNRSALEWIIDQYQVSMDKRSGITNDPNREDPGAGSGGRLGFASA